jgi:putative transposase
MQRGALRAHLCPSDSFPAAYWRLIRTNNPLERIMHEIRPRTRVVGTFPDGKSALMLSVVGL